MYYLRIEDFFYLNMGRVAEGVSNKSGTRRESVRIRTGRKMEININKCKENYRTRIWIGVNELMSFLLPGNNLKK